MLSLDFNLKLLNFEKQLRLLPPWAVLTLAARAVSVAPQSPPGRPGATVGVRGRRDQTSCRKAVKFPEKTLVASSPPPISPP